MATLAARIFLSEQDTISKSFDRMLLLKEEHLAAAGTCCAAADEPVYVILIPITGDLCYTDVYSGRLEAGVGQVLISRMPAGGSFGIENPYAEDEICFVQIRVRCDDPVLPGNAMVSSFDLAEAGYKPAELTSALPDLSFKLSLARFTGREEGIYKIKETSRGMFCFAIAGAFEIEGRLLHPKDGLSLWDIESAEMEALSNNALLLLLEV